jgi:glycosyltransferase involved in cell wall biosynthesis
VTSAPRVLVPRLAWPDDRFPEWAVAALLAAGAHVDVADRRWPRRWDAAVLPAVRTPDVAPPGSRRVGRLIGLLDVPPRPGDQLLQGADVVATSAALAAAWPGGQARVVRPAVSPGTSAAAPGPVLRVASVAPLHWSAGHEHAVAAVAVLLGEGVRVELRVAGDGPAREAVLFTAFDLGIEGAVSLVAADERAAVRESHAVVVAAVEDRAWTGLLHAFACGVPAIASDFPTTRELGGAQLVPPRDAVALAGVLSALAGDPAVRADVAARARPAATTDVAACGRALLGTGTR